MTTLLDFADVRVEGLFKIAFIWGAEKLARPLTGGIAGPDYVELGCFKSKESAAFMLSIEFVVFVPFESVVVETCFYIPTLRV